MNKPKYSIIPKPQKYDVLDGTYTVTSETQVLCNPEFIKAGNYLSAFLKTKKDANCGAIKFNKDEKISISSCSSCNHHVIMREREYRAVRRSY